MNKNIINYIYILIGLVLILLGFYFFKERKDNSSDILWYVIMLLCGMFIISKVLRKTKDLPSKGFKDKLRNK